MKEDGVPSYKTLDFLNDKGVDCLGFRSGGQ